MLLDSCKICFKINWQSQALCVNCADNISGQTLWCRMQKDLTCYSLLRYRGVVKNLIKDCKGGGHKALISELSTLLVKNFWEQVDVNQKFKGVIPIPSRRKKQKDHAYLIAETVSELMSLPLVGEVLTHKEGTGPQKQKNLLERSQISFYCQRPLIEVANDPGGMWILVDDVITTGLTMIEAQNALAQGPCLGLTLAARPYML